VVKEEEDAFLRTLDKGLKRIDDIIVKVENKTIAGKDAFELFDTFGFPIDLTRLIAQENSLNVDEAGFEAEMQQQKNRSRAATAIDVDDWNVLSALTHSSFKGYDSLEIETYGLKYRKVNSKGKELWQLAIADCPFYAESGGQVGDTGTLTFKNTGEIINVIDTKKENDLILLYLDNKPLNASGSILAKVNRSKRKATAANHSATHLLHAALRTILGTHVAQKGSLVNEEQLRFDFLISVK